MCQFPGNGQQTYLFTTPEVWVRGGNIYTPDFAPKSDQTNEGNFKNESVKNNTQ